VLLLLAWPARATRRARGHAKVLAQCLTFIFGAVKPAALHFRHDQVGEIVECGRHVRRQQVEAVGALFKEPLFQLIDDLGRGTDQGPVVFAGGGPHCDLAQRQVVAFGHARIIHRRAHARFVADQIRHRRIDIKARQVDAAKHAAQAVNRHRKRNELLQTLEFF
jgi:hypothetical protein